MVVARTVPPCSRYQAGKTVPPPKKEIRNGVREIIRKELQTSSGRQTNPKTQINRPVPISSPPLVLRGRVRVGAPSSILPRITEGGGKGNRDVNPCRCHRQAVR